MFSKFIMSILAVMAIVSMSFAANVAVRGDASVPANVVSVSLTDEVVDSTAANPDTIAISGYNIYGPVFLGPKGASFPSGLQITVPQGTVATGDSIQISYQMVARPSLSDTVGSGWTVTDTATLAGKFGRYQSLTSLVGNAVFVKIANIDGTRVEIGKQVRVTIKY